MWHRILKNGDFLLQKTDKPEIRNPNIEIRNKFEIRILKCSKRITTKVAKIMIIILNVWILEFKIFVLVSNFGFRASDL